MTETSSALPNLLIVVGSLRAASASKALANAIAERIGPGAQIAFAQIGGMPLYNADLDQPPEVQAFIEQVSRADGVLFVTPEYNYSVPGLLKNAIDWASRPAYNSVFLGKECFVISVSGGAMGGVRAQAHLKYILNGMVAKLFASQEVIVPFGNERTVSGIFTHEPTLEFASSRVLAFLEHLVQLRTATK